MVEHDYMDEAPAAGTQTEAWQFGYDACLANPLTMIDSLPGAGRTGLTDPILLRIRTRLLDLHKSRSHAA